MARLARVVVPDLPHHITQRGNGRAKTFFKQADYALYRDLLAQACKTAGISVWAWALMPNHVHLILQPKNADSLRQALAATHRRYAGHIHARLKRSGHFWQGRFGSTVMDEQHLLTAIRYVVNNPVRARLVKTAAQWPWSSARAHLGQVNDDGITDTHLAAALIQDFDDYLAMPNDTEMLQRLRCAESTGRPSGSIEFFKQLEIQTGRTLRPAKRGRKPKHHTDDSLTGET